MHNLLSGQLVSALGSMLPHFAGLPTLTVVGAGVVLAVVALSRILECARDFRQFENRLTLQHRAAPVEGGRNRILEMLVSNEPLGSVLDAIARMVADQMPGGSCIVLLKKDSGKPLRGGKQLPGTPVATEIGAACLAAPEWCDAFIQAASLPFEIWRQPCSYTSLPEHPAWRDFCALSPVSVPGTCRSLPIGEAGVPIGALVLLYPDQPPVGDQWMTSLQPVARLAQIAIEHRRFCLELKQLDTAILRSDARS